MGRKAHYVGRDGEGEVRTFDDWLACAAFSHGQPGGQAGNFRCDTEVEMAAEWLRAHPTTNIAAAKNIWTEEYKKLQQNPDAASGHLASPHKSRSGCVFNSSSPASHNPIPAVPKTKPDDEFFFRKSLLPEFHRFKIVTINSHAIGSSGGTRPRLGDATRG